MIETNKELHSKGGRKLSVVTKEMLESERALMASGSYNLYARARIIGVKYGTLRWHLRRPQSGFKKQKRTPTIGKRVRALLMAGDHLEKQIGIDTEAKREARAIWHKAKKAFRTSYDQPEA